MQAMNDSLPFLGAKDDLKRARDMKHKGLQKARRPSTYKRAWSSLKHRAGIAESAQFHEHVRVVISNTSLPEARYHGTIVSVRSLWGGSVYDVKLRDDEAPKMFLKEDMTLLMPNDDEGTVASDERKDDAVVSDKDAEILESRFDVWQAWFLALYECTCA